MLLLLVFLGCAGLMGFGLVLQYVKGLEPCPMCIMQRYAFILVGLVALAGALHNPGLLGVRGYGALMTLLAAAGGGVALRQTWIQIYPPATMGCGPDLEYMVGSFPLSQALPMIFQGTGDCSVVQWTFLGLSIANWSAVCFTGLLVIGLYLVIAARKDV